MDPEQLVDAHIQSGCGRDGGGDHACRAPRPSRFGVLVPGSERPHRQTFKEKPAPNAISGPARTTRITCSRRWATTCSRTKTLVEAVRADAENKDSAHDMGGNIITMLVNSGRAAVYDFATESRAGRRPSATPATGATSARSDSYYEAQMDLDQRPPDVQPVQSSSGRSTRVDASLPPAKFVFDQDGRRGYGARLHGQRRASSSPAVLVRRSILSRRGHRALVCRRSRTRVLMHDVEHRTRRHRAAGNHRQGRQGPARRAYRPESWTPIAQRGFTVSRKRRGGARQGRRRGS